MDFFGLIFFIVFVFIFTNLNKKVKEKIRSAKFDIKNIGSERVPEFVVPPALNKLMPGGKEIEKIVTVYGTGALVTVDDVAVLLNVSQETAQNYLSSLVNDGRAEHNLSASGTVRYKLK